MSGNFLIVLPVPGVTHPPVAEEWARFPPWYGWLDAEVHILLPWFGVRAGLAPLQVVDFLAGWLGLDPFKDDVPPL
jgi:hypothetical protein